MRRRQEKTQLVRRVQAIAGRPIAAICRALGVSRSTAYRQTKARPRFLRRAEDEAVLEEIRKGIGRRDSYGHRRVRAILNRPPGKRPTTGSGSEEPCACMG